MTEEDRQAIIDRCIRADPSLAVNGLVRWSDLREELRDYEVGCSGVTYEDLLKKSPAFPPGPRLIEQVVNYRS